MKANKIFQWWGQHKTKRWFRTAAKLVQQSWLPAVIAVCYAAWDWFSTSEPSIKRAFEKFVTGFFFAMWFVMQFLRAQKQVDDHEQTEVIRGMQVTLKTLLEIATLDNRKEKSEDAQKPEVQLITEYNNSHRQFTELSVMGVGQDPQQIARKYTAAAEELADRGIEKAAKLPVNISRLSIEELRRVHSAIFPQGYKLGGQIRTVQVSISQEGSTTLGEFPGTLVTPDPQQMLGMLQELLDSWNRRVDSLRTSSRDEKIEAIAKFHHRFAMIHPFLDGNGRMIRILLVHQIAYLFDVNADIAALKQSVEYTAAFRAADQGNLLPLRKIIEGLVPRKD
ncbi:MAG: Fic family protein [Bdellovibrionales bacterium]|nr:Fic family protein [Bdellovibrionales bacterium]